MMGTLEQESTNQAGCNQIEEVRDQERIVHFVLGDWMGVPTEREPSRSSPTTRGATTLPEVTSFTEVGTEHQQQYADLVGPSDRVFEVRMNDGGVTATALIAHLMRDDRLELLQAYCEWPLEGQKRELDAQRQLALA
jgi:hypothetical protein